MPSVIVSESFVASTAQVHSERVFDALYHFIELLESLPELASRDLPPSIKRRFGEGCRKIVVDPFDVLYRYDSENDVVYVVELIHQRSVH